VSATEILPLLFRIEYMPFYVVAWPRSADGKFASAIIELHFERSAWIWFLALIQRLMSSHYTRFSANLDFYHNSSIVKRKEWDSMPHIISRFEISQGNNLMNKIETSCNWKPYSQRFRLFQLYKYYYLELIQITQLLSFGIYITVRKSISGSKKVSWRT